MLVILQLHQVPLQRTTTVKFGVANGNKPVWHSENMIVYSSPQRRFAIVKNFRIINRCIHDQPFRIPNEYNVPVHLFCPPVIIAVLFKPSFKLQTNHFSPINHPHHARNIEKQLSLPPSSPAPLWINLRTPSFWDGPCCRLLIPSPPPHLTEIQSW